MNRSDSESGGSDRTQNLTGVRVLVVEDDPTNRIVARALLTRFGCDVEFAENGEIAVQKVQGAEYDVIFMDCMMPVMDGFDATLAIRKWESQAKRHVPIVAFTALSRPEDKQHCFDAGMDDFISKPARTEIFRQVIERWTQHDNEREAVRS